MNTHQLQCTISCDEEMNKEVYGVFASDEISDIQLKPNTGFIVNTDVKRLPGKHWVAFFLSESHTLEIFDSYGSSANQLLIYFKDFMVKYSNVRVNRKRLQSRETAVCGHYCLFYLMCRTRGYTMDHITDLFSDNYKLNDQFVYNFIDERFHCCMTFVNYVSQSCTCE